jgi:hypothetical protein
MKDIFFNNLPSNEQQTFDILNSSFHSIMREAKSVYDNYIKYVQENPYNLTPEIVMDKLIAENTLDMSSDDIEFIVQCLKTLINGVVPNKLNDKTPVIMERPIIRKV